MSIAVGQINSAIQLSDADGDTKIQVEESADEDKIRFDTGGTERAIIDSTGLGIGVTAPANLLQIKTTVDGSGLTIQRDSTTVDTYSQLSFINTTTDNFTPPTWIRTLRDSGGANASPMTFGTAGTERVRINSAGNVGIGTSANNNELGGIRFVNANNADDDGLDADGKFVAAISARSVTSDSNAGDDSGADLVFYTKPEAGNYAERARFLSSGGLTFNGDTATANALDDYEEGTWTPSTSSNGTVSNAQGFYVKIGKMVHVLFYFSLSGVTTSTAVNVAGLPYAVQDNIGPSNVGGTGAIFGDLTNFLAFAQEASSLLTIEYDRPLSGTSATSANLRGSVTYMTAL